MAEQIPDRCFGRIAVAIEDNGRRVVYVRCANRPTHVSQDLCGTYYYCFECAEVVL